MYGSSHLRSEHLYLPAEQRPFHSHIPHLPAQEIILCLSAPHHY